MKPSDRAWCVLGSGVVIYNLCSNDGETLSEGVDRYLEKSPHKTRLIVAILAVHLVNVVPKQYDPVHFLFVMLKLKRKVRQHMISETEEWDNRYRASP